MIRITLIDPQNATGTAGAQLAEIKAVFGVVPNMFRAVANSPAALTRLNVPVDFPGVKLTRAA